MESGQGGATDEEWRAALSEYRRQKRVCDEGNGLLRSIVKRWKAAGVPIASMLATAKATKRDPDEVVVEFSNTVRFMNIARIPVTPQSLFPEGVEVRLSDRAEYEADMWEAEDKGYRAGRTNVPLGDAPYEFGSEAHVTWQKWWHNGQASIARELGENAKQANASRAHPGRENDETTVQGVEASVAAGPRKRGRPKKSAAAAASGRAPRRRRAANGMQPPAAA